MASRLLKLFDIIIINSKSSYQIIIVGFENLFKLN